MLNSLRKSHLIFLLWCALSAFTIYEATKVEPHPTGDGIEYMLSTEAWINHGSPNIKYTDFVQFKADYSRSQPWSSAYKSVAFDEVGDFLKNPRGKEYGGFFRNTNGHVFGYHFVFYALINVPGRVFTKAFQLNPMSSYTYTNAFLLMAMFWVVLWLWKETEIVKVICTLALALGGVLYYLGWSHPEVLTCVLIVFSLVAWQNQKPHWSLFWMALGTLQNPPLIVVLICLGLAHNLKSKFKWLPLLKSMSIGALFFIPMLYFYALFGTTSLIKDAGFLSLTNITGTRVFGFFFDLNQGMILVLGALLLVYPVLYVYQSRQAIKELKISEWTAIPILILIMVLIVSAMSNWNHGMAIVNRYAVWISIPLVFHFIIMLKTLRRRSQIVLGLVVCASQAMLFIVHRPYNRFDWSNLEHMPLAKWTIVNVPEMYNPDPQIFIARTTKQFDFSLKASPVFYLDSDDKVCKVAVHEANLDTLLSLGYPKERIRSSVRVKCGPDSWYYINDYEQFVKVKGALVKSVKKREINRIVLEIKQNPEWMKNIEEKANDAHVSVESQLLMDAEYVYESNH